MQPSDSPISRSAPSFKSAERANLLGILTARLFPHLLTLTSMYIRRIYFFRSRQSILSTLDHKLPCLFRKIDQRSGYPFDHCQFVGRAPAPEESPQPPPNHYRSFPVSPRRPISLSQSTIRAHWWLILLPSWLFVYSIEYQHLTSQTTKRRHISNIRDRFIKDSHDKVGISFGDIHRRGETNCLPPEAALAQ